MPLLVIIPRTPATVLHEMCRGLICLRPCIPPGRPLTDHTVTTERPIDVVVLSLTLTVLLGSCSGLSADKVWWYPSLIVLLMYSPLILNTERHVLSTAYVERPTATVDPGFALDGVDGDGDGCADRLAITAPDQCLDDPITHPQRTDPLQHSLFHHRRSSPWSRQKWPTPHPPHVVVSDHRPLSTPRPIHRHASIARHCTRSSARVRLGSLSSN